MGILSYLSNEASKARFSNERWADGTIEKSHKKVEKTIFKIAAVASVAIAALAAMVFFFPAPLAALFVVTLVATLGVVAALKANDVYHGVKYQAGEYFSIHYSANSKSE